MTLLSASQAHSERLNSMAHAYQMGMRIISNEDIVVCAESHPHMGAAAWTDGIKITLNADKIDDVDAANVERMRGVNLHEMAHVLFSPRAGSVLMVWVLDRGHMQHFNILEDQRIETFLTRMYPSTAPWLTTAITRWVLKGGDPEIGYAFVRGRKYLPGKLRGAFRANFGKPELLPRLDAIVDEYRELVFPRDYARAQALIQDWADLFREMYPDVPAPTGDPNAHAERPEGPMTEGTPKGQSKQQDAASRNGGEEDEEMPPSSSDSQSSGANPDKQDDNASPDKAPSESENSAESAGADADAGSDSDSESGGSGSTGAGSPRDGAPGSEDSGKPASSDGGQPTDRAADAGNTPSSTTGASNAAAGAHQDLLDIAQEVLDDVLSRTDIQDDIRRTMKQIKSAGGSDIIDKTTDWKMVPPEEEYAVLLKGLRRVIDRLVQKADPGWDRRVSGGKLNAARWYRDRDIDTAYDMWDEGISDAFDLEVVVLMDESASMRSAMKQVLNSMWVVKRAFDKVNVSTTVITFSDTSHILYHRKDKAAGQVRHAFHSGGTDPSGGLAQATRIFARSDKSQKILLVFTDGDWGTSSDPAGERVHSDTYIKRMANSGVTTALGFIDADGARPDKIRDHGCRVSGQVTSRTLVPFMTSVITSSIQSKLTGR